MPDILDTLVIGPAPTGRPVPLDPRTPGAPVVQLSQPNEGPDAPNAQTSQAQPARLAPGVVPSAIADPDAPPFELNHARILYASALAGAAVTATAGTGAANVLNAATYSRWSFTGAQTITMTLPAAQSIDAVGLGAHSFASSSALVQFSTSDAGAWEDFAPAQSGSAAMLFLRTAAASVKRLRVTVTATGAQVLGVIYAGIALQMQRPIYKGHNPATMARVTEYQSNESEGGQWLGRNVIRQGLKVDLSWSRLSANWVRQYFDPFAVSARVAPFFVAWNPQDFPREVAYAWTTADTKPDNTGPRDLMSVSLQAKGAA